ncbi:hypothetical protein JTE90_009955 [Oedothorax gibbosus]|uniref:Galectin n=1 Tax=Oedothorax gibbosus TaxID=931172 RepID=A0AAV6V982_9ARAC|nr:hypothetical protein JTE90_009955 [Oedothorax gibbosus]
MSVVSRILKAAEAEAGLHYRNPRRRLDQRTTRYSRNFYFDCAGQLKSVPHACSIPGGLCIGSKIYIHGILPKDASQFSISLQRGADPDNAELHLHLLAKQLGRLPVVVRNSRLAGSWGAEEPLPGAFPFPLHPRPFLLVITAYVDSFEVEIAGSSNQFSFKVRDGLPISSITHLAIEAELAVRAIHIPVENMPRNLRLSLGSGAKVGDMYTIRGQPTESASSFNINWQSGPAKYDDILYTLNPRLSTGRVISNSRIDETMGPEEASDDCPFEREKTFKLNVGVAPLAFDVRVDGKELVNFKHRHDVSAAKTLFFEGDMQPEDICIDLAQMNPLGILNGTNIKSRGIRLQQFCPELPMSSRVTGGFEKGCIFLLSGKVHNNPSRMQMTVQCGDGTDDSDVALRYLAKWEDDLTPKITLNCREMDKWSQETKTTVENDGHLHPGLPFDLLVIRTENDEFKCILNGLEHALFPYRLEDTKPDHVTVCGDVEIHRLLLV